MLANSRADAVSPWLARARQCIDLADDDAAEQAYLEALGIDATHFEALNDLGVLALRRGRRGAARLAHRQALRFHADAPIAHVNLANILLEDGERAAARTHYLAALAADPGFAPAHRGLARFYDFDGDSRAAEHWRLGASGAAIERRPKRGVGPAIPVLLLASAKLGNMPIEPWLDDTLFDAHIVTLEYAAERAPTPPHALILNLVGDADLCGDALARAEGLIAASAAPTLNRPARVAATGRLANARRLGALPDVAAPWMASMKRDRLADAEGLKFPLLLRAPGFHAGRHFLRVERREDLCDALAALPGEQILAMQCLDARGPDGFFRKYRVMGIGGALYPLHLAVSLDWKVHYFSADMAERPEHRDEERRFLDDMNRALGARAMRALAAIAEVVGLDYFGVDFALRADGALLLFEANAAMAMLDPPTGTMWDYRRPALAAARAAARRMVAARASAASSDASPTDLSPASACVKRFPPL